MFFTCDLKDKLKQTDSINYALFEEIFENVLDKCAPPKDKMQRVNHKPYVYKSNAESHHEMVRMLKKQRNFCSRLYKKARQKYYGNLDFRKIADNKKFWNTVKPCFSNRRPTSQKISLKKGDELVTDDIEIANKLSKHFVNSVQCLAEKGSCSAHVLDINGEKIL